MIFKFATLFLFSLLLTVDSFNVVGQNPLIEWDDTDRGKIHSLEKSFRVGDNQVIIIEKTTTKPMGLKPYLYTLNEDNQSLTVKQIDGLKNMEVYSEFFTQAFSFETIGETTYRIDIENIKSKPKNNVYTVSIQQINLNDLSRVGEKITLLNSEVSINDGELFSISNNKYLAIIKSGASLIQPYFEEGEGFDVFVYNASNFELVYSKKISLSSDEENGIRPSIELREDGSLFIHTTFINKDSQNKVKDDPEQLKKVKTINVSNNTFTENIIEFDQSSVTMDLISNKKDILINLIADKDKSNLRLVTIVNPYENDLFTDEKFISLPEILNKNNAAFSNRFSQTLQNSENLYVSLTHSEKHTLSNGETIFVCGLKFRPDKGMGLANTLYCTIVYRIDLEGNIVWYNVIPLGGFACSILDKEDNLHIYANGITEEYNINGDYIGNNKTEVNADLSPVEAVINEKTGELISNRVMTNGFKVDEAFAIPDVFYKFNENCSLIGKNNQERLNEMAGNTQNGITFGIVKF